MAANIPTPITMYRGDTWNRQWTLKDRFKRPVDITNCAIRLHVRDSDDVKVLEAKTQTGEITYDGPNGRITMVLQTTSVSPGTYFYDLEITFVDGSVLTVDGNSITFLQDMSHDD